MNSADYLKNICYKVYTFFANKNEIIDGLKDINSIDLPGFDKKLVINTLNKEIESCIQRYKSLTLLMIEIDYFNHYIETFGIEAGKKVLNSVKETLNKRTRDSDLCFSDEEGKFIIILPEAIQEEVLNIASRVRDIVTKQVYNPFEGSDQIIIKLTVSIGSANTNSIDAAKNINGERLLRNAQSALDEGKKKGINQINLG